MWPDNDEEAIPACVRIVPHRGRDEWVFPDKPPRTRFSTEQLDDAAPMSEVERKLLMQADPPESAQRVIEARIAVASQYKRGGV